MTTTSTQRFTMNVGSFLARDILGPLVEWLRTNKNIELTVDECVKALDLPALAPVAQASMPTLPGLQSPVAKASPQRTPAKKAPTPGDGPGCPYSFSRGQYKGQICGAKVAPGETYCNACKKKKIVGGSPGTTAPSGASSAPGLKGTTTKVQPKTLDVVELPEKDWYKDINNNFIVRRMPDGKIMALAVEDKGTYRHLNDAEKAVATQYQPSGGR